MPINNMFISCRHKNDQILSILTFIQQRFVMPLYHPLTNRAIRRIKKNKSSRLLKCQRIKTLFHKNQID